MFAVMFGAALATQPLHQSSVVPIIDGAASRLLHLESETLCYDRTIVKVSVKDGSRHPGVRELVVGEVSLAAEELAKWNVQLAALDGFRSISVECEPDGPIIAVNGQRSAEIGGPTVVIVAWKRGHLQTAPSALQK